MSCESITGRLGGNTTTCFADCVNQKQMHINQSLADFEINDMIGYFHDDVIYYVHVIYIVICFLNS